MATRLFALCLAFLTLPAHLPTALAWQAPLQEEWSAVQAVSIGEEMLIEMKNGERLKGRLSGVSDTTLTLSRKNGSTELDRTNIAEVYRVMGKAAKAKYALIGAGVGAAVGVLAGKAKNSPPIDDGEIYLMIGATVGTGLGALVGAALGGTRRKRVLLYQAR